MKKSKYTDKMMDLVEDTLLDMGASEDFTISDDEDEHLILHLEHDDSREMITMELDGLYRQKEEEDVKIKDQYRNVLKSRVVGFVEMIRDRQETSLQVAEETVTRNLENSDIRADLITSDRIHRMAERIFQGLDAQEAYDKLLEELDAPEPEPAYEEDDYEDEDEDYDDEEEDYEEDDYEDEDYEDEDYEDTSYGDYEPILVNRDIALGMDKVYYEPILGTDMVLIYHNPENGYAMEPGFSYNSDLNIEIVPFAEIVPPFFQIPDNFYVMYSTNKNSYGASGLLQPEVMEKVRDILGTEDFYILPANNKQVVFAKDCSLSYLQEMVSDITRVPAGTAYLTDRIYTYDYKDHALTEAKEKDQEKEER